MLQCCCDVLDVRQMIKDAASYRALVVAALPLFDLIKISAEDLEILFGRGLSREEVGGTASTTEPQTARQLAGVLSSTPEHSGGEGGAAGSGRYVLTVADPSGVGRSPSQPTH
jgi:hypothetical protein